MKKNLRGLFALCVAMMLTSGASNALALSPTETASQLVNKAQQAIEAAHNALDAAQRAEQNKTPDAGKKYDKWLDAWGDAKKALATASEAVKAFSEGSTKEKFKEQLDEQDAILKVLGLRDCINLACAAAMIEWQEETVKGVTHDAAKKTAEDFLDKQIKDAQDAINKLPQDKQGRLLKDLNAAREKCKDKIKLSALPGNAAGTYASLARAGKVTDIVTGSGETIGVVATLSVSNSTGDLLNVIVPPTVLASTSGKYQSYALPQARGFVLGPHESLTVPLSGICLDGRLPPVGSELRGELELADPTSEDFAKRWAPSLAATQAIIETADELQRQRAYSTPFSRNPQRELDTIIQWTVWKDTAERQNRPLTKADLAQKVRSQAGTVSPEQEQQLSRGTDQLWAAIELTGAKAKLTPPTKTGIRFPNVHYSPGDKEKPPPPDGKKEGSNELPTEMVELQLPGGITPPQKPPERTITTPSAAISISVPLEQQCGFYEEKVLATVWTGWRVVSKGEVSTPTGRPVETVVWETEIYNIYEVTGKCTLKKGHGGDHQPPKRLMRGKITTVTREDDVPSGGEGKPPPDCGLPKAEDVVRKWQTNDKAKEK